MANDKGKSANDDRARAAEARRAASARSEREFGRLQREGNSPLMSLEIMKGRGQG